MSITVTYKILDWTSLGTWDVGQKEESVCKRCEGFESVCTLSRRVSILTTAAFSTTLRFSRDPMRYNSCSTIRRRWSVSSCLPTRDRALDSFLDRSSILPDCDEIIQTLSSGPDDLGRGTRGAAHQTECRYLSEASNESLSQID